MHTNTGIAAIASPSGEISLAHWERTMRRAIGAARLGQTVLALAVFQQALALARELLGAPPPGRADDCVAALVVSHHNLADLQAEAGSNELAAAQLGRAHEALMAIVRDPAQDGAMQRAALRHSRETHAGLLRHLAEHGDHPLITRALRAGCLAIGLGGGATLH